jgi:prepilin-type N-terminal cleavage/methylation domain-containing protein
MPSKNFKKAYSLIELSIVILIISILITGALSVSVNSINNAKIKVTNDRIAEIYKALGSYLLINKKLPCPAALTLEKTNGSYGTAGTDGTCTAAGIYLSTTSGALSLVYGMVPFKALGLTSDVAEDGFGSKISYVVHRDFTTTIAYNTGGHTTTVPYDPASAIIQIKDKVSGVISTSYAIFALIGHGANKSGAFNAASASTTPNTRSADADEMDNDTGTISGTTANFDTMFISSSTSSDVFDDVVFAKNRTQMLQDFNAYSVIPCAATSENPLYGITINWPAGSYGQVVVSSTNCPAGYTSGVTKPTKRCGEFGVWQSGVVNPCLAP